MKKFLLLILIAVTYCNYSYSQVLFSEEFKTTDNLSNWNNVDLTGANPTNGIWKQYSSTTSMPFPTAANGYAFFLSSTDNGTQYVDDGKPENGALSNKVPFSCVGSSKVFVEFYEYFNYFTSINAIAYVEASTDGTNWTVISARDTFVNDGGKVRVNATSVLANTATGYLRFRYKGSHAGIWRVDDLFVYVPDKFDITTISINEPSYRPAGQNQKIEFIVTNNGSDTVTSISTNLYVDGVLFKNYPVTGLSIPPLATAVVTLNSDWAPTEGMYKIYIETDKLNGNNPDKINTDNKSKEKNLTIYGTSTVARKPLYEIFTSSTCGPCTAGNENFHSIVDPLDQKSFVTVKYQQNYPGTGDPYNTVETKNRAGYYSINSIPRMEIDGQWDGNAASFTIDEHNYFKSIPSIIDLSGTYKYDSATKTINYNYKFKPLIKLPSGLTKVHVAVVEKSTTKNIKSNGETIFYNVVKKMLPDDKGMSLNDSSLTANKVTNISGKFVIPGNYRLPGDGTTAKIINLATENSIENPKNLYVVVWAQQNDTKLVLQSESLTNLADTPIVIPNPTNNLDSVYKVSYDTSKVTSIDLVKHYKFLSSSNIQWSVDKVAISDSWNFISVCDNTDCYNAPITSTKSFVATGDSVKDELKVTIDHRKFPGYGYVTLKLVKPNGTSYTKFSLFVKSTKSTVSIITPVDEKVLYYFDNTIYLDNEFKNSTLNVFDINGKLVVSNKITNNFIDFNNYAKGLYIANIVKEGAVIKTLKFDSSK